MNLKKIILMSAMLLSNAVASQSLDKLQFDVCSKSEGFFSPKINSSLKIYPNELDFAFSSIIYSIDFNFKKINDSTYQEFVKSCLLWKLKEELFEYSYNEKDSSYTFNRYSVIGEKPRPEKEILVGTHFDKKFKTPPKIFKNLEKGLLDDSVHFIVFGEPYSIKIGNNVKDGERIYFCDPKDVIKQEPGDFFVFPYPLELHTKRKDGKITPYLFFTKFLNAKNGKSTYIKGELIEK
jgi:hypothetical protein